jgi:NADH-quinone oxidoreductase subunit N
MISSTDLLALLPFLVLAAGATALLILGALGALRSGALHGTSLGILLAAFFSLRFLPELPRQVTPLLRMDAFSVTFLVLILGAALVVLAGSREYLAARRLDGEAFYGLFLFATLGMALLAAANHMASLFLGLETLSVSLYALIAHDREERRSIEAGLKYLVLAGVGSAFLLYGMALLYADSRALSFPALQQALLGGVLSAWGYAGAGLLFCGLAFKLAAVPFHLWSPDVYQGAPTPVTTLIATGSKGATAAVLLRATGFLPLGGDEWFGTAVWVIALASMTCGNLYALLQTDLKRLLAGSSIAHMGYLLVAFLVGGQAAVSAGSFFLLTYLPTTLLAFGVILALSHERDVTHIDEYRGLSRRRPWLAAALGLALFSLAGIPLTGGFVGKFAVFRAAIDHGFYFLAVFGVLNSVISVVYYLRVVVAIFLSDPTQAEEAPASAPATIPATAALLLAALVLLFFGLYPEPLFVLTREIALAI